MSRSFAALAVGSFVIDGRNMLVIPEDSLLGQAEDERDIQAYDAATGRLASGEDELIPIEFADRLINGESPVRVYRELRGMSSAELASKVGVSRPFLHQLEKGDRGGRFDTMKRIAEALRVSLDDLA